VLTTSVILFDGLVLSLAVLVFSSSSLLISLKGLVSLDLYSSIISRYDFRFYMDMPRFFLFGSFTKDKKAGSSADCCFYMVRLDSCL